MGKRSRRGRRNTSRKPNRSDRNVSDDEIHSSDSSCEEETSSDPEWQEFLPKKKSNHGYADNSRWQGRLRGTILKSLLDQSASHLHEMKAPAPKPASAPPPFIPRTLEELINLAHLQQQTRVSYLDCERLPQLLPHLLELRAMVGLQEIKASIVQLVLTYSQSQLPRPVLNHAVVYGRPGVGKTTFVNIFARIMSCLGVVEGGKVVHASQENMVAGFLGQTAEKTQSLVESAFGGVLLIDEANSLADGRNAQNTDSFSKSAIDTLNRLLTEKAHEFMCILSGYEDEIQRDFFSVNPGLARRFPTVYRIGAYSAQELADIAKLQIQNQGLQLQNPDSITAEMFAGHKSVFFEAMGGDITTLVAKITSVHSIEVFGKLIKNTISDQSVAQGFDAFTEMKSSLKRASTYYPDMYV